MKIFILRSCERIGDSTQFSPLTDSGTYNSFNLVNILEEEKIDVIFSSPYIRCIDTINPFSKKNSININIEYSLIEFLNEKLIPQSSYKIELPDNIKKNYLINKNYKELLSIEDLKYNENLDDVLKRMKYFIKYIFKEYGLTDKNILIISHMVPINVLLNYITKTYIKDKLYDIQTIYKSGSITKIFEYDSWCLYNISKNLEKNKLVENASNENTSNDNTSNDNSSNDNTSNDNISSENTSNENTSNENTNNKKNEELINITNLSISD